MYVRAVPLTIALLTEELDPYSTDYRANHQFGVVGGC
jgi:hypothetical protein